MLFLCVTSCPARSAVHLCKKLDLSILCGEDRRAASGALLRRVVTQQVETWAPTRSASATVSVPVESGGYLLCKGSCDNISTTFFFFCLYLVCHFSVCSVFVVFLPQRGFSRVLRREIRAFKCWSLLTRYVSLSTTDDLSQNQWWPCRSVLYSRRDDLWSSAFLKDKNQC